MNIDKCVNLDDLRVLAKKRVPKLVYDFIEGGVDDEEGLQRNEDAFQRRSLVPRYMVDISTLDQSVELFGRTWSSPYGIAPTGGIGNYRRGGDLMLVRAARDANIPFIMSGAANASMEEMAREAPEHGWYQMYTAKDRSISEDMIRRAADLGIPALVVTVDVPVHSNRERNRRNGFGRPLKLTLRTKLDTLRHPAWLKDYMKQGFAMLENWKPYAPEAPAPCRWATSWRADAGQHYLGGYRAVPGALAAHADPEGRDAHGRCAPSGGDRRGRADGLEPRRPPARPRALPAGCAACARRGCRRQDGADAGWRRPPGRGHIDCARKRGEVRVPRPADPLRHGRRRRGRAVKAMDILREEIDKVMAQVGCPSLDRLGPDSCTGTRRHSAQHPPLTAATGSRKRRLELWRAMPGESRVKIDKCVNLDDLRVLAKRRVPKLVYDYIEGGVDDEGGLRRNEEAFRRRSLVPRYMVDVSTLDRSVALFGRTWASPYGIAPTGGIGHFRRGGDAMLWRPRGTRISPSSCRLSPPPRWRTWRARRPSMAGTSWAAAKDRSISEDRSGAPPTSAFPPWWSRSMRRSIPTRSATGATASAASSRSRPGWRRSAIRSG